MYNVNASDENQFITDIGSISVEAQKKLIDNLNGILKDKEAYHTYYKFAEMAQKVPTFLKMS